MKTVGEFNSACLEIVVGDRAIRVDSQDSFCLYTGFRWVNLSNGSHACEGWLITEFAWRTNTGVKTGFKGRIDFEHRDGSIYENKDIDISVYGDSWDIKKAPSDIVRWRPHLEVEAAEATTEEVKPVFTREIVDKGELPPIGVKCILSYYDCELHNGLRAGDEVEIFSHLKTSSGGEVAAFKHYDAYGNFCVEIAVASCFKPIKTEREKVIEKAALALKKKYGDILGDAYEEYCATLFDAELLK